MRAGKQSFLPDDFDDENENESSIRRACSLSDLSMGKGKNHQLIIISFLHVIVHVWMWFSCEKISNRKNLNGFLII